MIVHMHTHFLPFSTQKLYTPTLKETWCLMVSPQKTQGLLGTERWETGEGMEVGVEGDYIPIATLSPPE